MNNIYGDDSEEDRVTYEDPEVFGIASKLIKSQTISYDKSLPNISNYKSLFQYRRNNKSNVRYYLYCTTDDGLYIYLIDFLFDA
jgi:hypothetical protein